MHLFLIQYSILGNMNNYFLYMLLIYYFLEEINN